MSDWRSTTLQEIISTIESGSRPKGGIRIGENSEGVPSYGGENISMNGRMLYDSVRMVPANFAAEMKRGILSDRDVLINKDGANTGKSAIYRRPAGEEFATINEHLFLIRCNKDAADQEFLYHFLNSELGKSQIARVITGSAQPGLNSTFPEFIRIDLPPLPEQKKIAEILSGIDSTIAAALKEKQHRDRLRRSAIKQLTRGASFSGQRKDSGTEFGMIPSHWECLLIPDCCTIENSKRKPIKKEERSKMRGTHPYHGATRIQDYISEYAYEGDYVLIGEDGDHFSKYDEWEMAQYATGRFNVSNHAHVIKGAHNCSTKWLYYSLLHRDLTYHLTRQGATRFKLSKASLECIPVIFPPPEEQVKMISAFDSITRSISILGDRIIKLQALKTSLSSDLLSGRKRVSV